MRRILSSLLAATLAATAPGLPFYSTLSAQTFKSAPGRGAANSGRIAPIVNGRNLNLRSTSLQFNRNAQVPANLQLPQSAAIAAGQPLVSQDGVGSGESGVASGAAAQLGAAPALQVSPRTFGARMSELAKALTPQIQLAHQLAAASGGAESSNLAGHKMDALLQGVKNASAAGDVAAPAVGSERASSLNAPGARHEAQLDRRIVDLEFVTGDLETTGFYGEVHRPTQIGAIKIRFRENGMVEELGTYDTLVDPRQPVPAVITDFTGITHGDVQGAPSIKKGVVRFEQFAGPDSVHVFQNAPFDSGFLGQAAQENGLPIPSNLIIDTKKMIRSLMPKIKSSKLEWLIFKLKLGSSQEHTGLSDAKYAAQVLAKLVKMAAAKKRKKFSELTLRDLASYTPIDTYQSILARMEPKVVEKERQVPLPADFEAQASKWDRQLYKEEKPSMLRDIAYAMGVKYSELREALAAAAQKAKIAPTDAILAELRRNPGAGWIFDYDKTLTDNGADGLSTPVPDKVLKALIELLKRGPVGVVSSRAFDMQPKGVGFPNTIWEPLIKRIPAEFRGNLIFVGNVGGELVVFDSNNKTIPVMQSDWSKDERSLMDRLIQESFTALEMTPEQIAAVEIAGDMRAQVVIRFPKADADRAEAFSKLMAEKFRANQLKYPVAQNHEWVLWSKFDKDDAVRIVYPIMRERGFPVTEENLVIFGDHFRRGANGYYGIDAPMALAFPKSRGFTVGDKPTDKIPDNVRIVGITGSRGTYRAVEAILEGLDARAGKTSTKWGLSEYWGLMTAALAAALLLSAAIPFFFGPAVFSAVLSMSAADIAATVAAVLFMGIGIPQIISNHRGGEKTTKDVSLATNSWWLAGGIYLSASFWALGSSPIWVISNFLGVLNAAVILYQIISKNTNPNLYKERDNQAAILGAILSLPLVTAGAFFLPSSWAQMGVYAGISAILKMNWPQIKNNYRLWKDERRAPKLNAKTPMIVIVGAALNLFAAASAGELLWMLTSIASIVTVSVVLGQIAWPALKHGMVAGLHLAEPLKAKKPRVTDAEARKAGHDFMKEIEQTARLRPYGRISQGDYNEREYYAIEALSQAGATKRQIELFRKAAAKHPIPGGAWSRISSLD